jgi:hypothetical protein
MAGRKPNLPRRSSGLRPIHAGKAPVGYGELPTIEQVQAGLAGPGTPAKKKPSRRRMPKGGEA